MSRRRFLRLLGVGAATVAVAGAGGLTWRAIDQGVFATGTGEAYAAWAAWNDGSRNLALVRAAILAANAHDTQPWLFRIGDNRIDLFADPTRNIGTMDTLRREMTISLGCALENLTLAARAHGLGPSVTLMPDPSDLTHVARIDLAAAPASASPLFDAIPRRHTNRAAYDTRQPVEQVELDALSGLIDAPDLDLVWFTHPADKRAFGDLTVRATEAIIADPYQAADDYAWYRTSWGDVQSKKDGITIDAAGVSPLIRAVAKVLPVSARQSHDGWLASTRDTGVATAAAFGTLVVRDGLDPIQRLQAGRTWQRMHLHATTRGMAMQPLNQVEERMDREHTAGFAPTFTREMAAMIPAAWHPVMSFRIGYPTSEPFLSPRRPAEAVVRA